MTKKRILPVVLSAPTAAGVLVACDIDKSEAGELPDVEVDESGDLPEWDVDWADVDAGTTEETVTVPKLKVVMEEETVEVPYIDIGMPDDADTANRVRRMLTASALVPGSGYSGEKEMVSDRVVLNAPKLPDPRIS